MDRKEIVSDLLDTLRGWRRPQVKAWWAGPHRLIIYVRIDINQNAWFVNPHIDDFDLWGIFEQEYFLLRKIFRSYVKEHAPSHISFRTSERMLLEENMLRLTFIYEEK